MKKLALLFFLVQSLIYAQGEQRYADGTATDQDGNTFEWINYGTQDWAIENAEVVTYRDGTPIPQVNDATEWANLTTGAWCYYDNDPTKGKLYNWYAVAGIHDNDPNTPNKEYAPVGWHVPTDADWTTLENYLIANGYNYDGTTTENKIAKAVASSTGWESSPIGGVPGNNQSLNNSSGFNALPEGFRNNDGLFRDEANDAIFWSFTEVDYSNALGRDLSINDIFLFSNTDGKRWGFSVRFVRDASSLGSYRDILLNGTVSAENNQIKKVADPTDNLDAVNKRYVDQRTLEQTIPGQNIGDLLYWNGQSWQKLSAPQEQSTLRFCDGQLTWEPCAPEIYINVFSQNDSSFGVYGKVLFNGLLYNELGVVYSNTTQSPTINDIKAIDDDIEEYRNDDFAVYGSFDNLDLESTYFIRAYCISDKGVSYSKEVFSFTTGSLGSSAGGEYKKYGDQHWTLENYGEISYQDGTSIPQVTDATEWANLTTGAWCYYDNDPSKGKLYNWYAVAGIHDNDPNTPNKEFAPEGWHLPSDSEWTTLIEHFIANGYNYDGTTTGNKIAKAVASKTGWNTSTSTGSPGNNQSNNNSSEFNALPIGYRETNGGFFNEGNDVIFWTSSGNYSNSNASYRHLNKDNSSFNHWSYSMKMGYSVRFVKD